jgi:hypothetical protein
MSVVSAVESAQINQQIATAKRYPRDLAKVEKAIDAMVKLDEETAASCFYCLPRGNKTIEGPSIRFAEIVGNTYGNMRFGARVIDEGQEFITAQGVAHDLENNVCVTTEVRRRITTSQNKRYGADMIAVTANAACLIALRNAIFKAVPFSLAKAIYEQAKKVAVGNATTLIERRGKMIDAFGKISRLDPFNDIQLSFGLRVQTAK